MRNSNVLAPAKPANKEKRHSCRFKERGRLAHTLIFQNTPPHDSRLPIDLQMAQFSPEQLKAAGLTSDSSAPIILIPR